MKRLAALVVAAALVVGASYVRQRITHHHDDGMKTTARTGAPTLVCATEVQAACTELGSDVRVRRVEPAGTTYARLAGGKALGADGWLVGQPWPAMLEMVGHPVAAISAPLARAPLQLVTTDSRPSGLSCDPVTWGCVAAFAAVGGRYAHAGPEETAGLVAEAAVAGGLLGKTDFATNDFDDVEDFRQRYATVERSVTGVTQGRSTDLVKDIQRIQGAYQAVTALRGDVELDRSGFEVVTPSPQVTADAVLAGHPDRFDLGRLQGALTTTGWWRSHDKRLDERNGLPNPGVMVALRNLSTR